MTCANDLRNQISIVRINKKYCQDVAQSLHSILTSQSMDFEKIDINTKYISTMTSSNLRLDILSRKLSEPQCIHDHGLLSLRYFNALAQQAETSEVGASFSEIGSSPEDGYLGKNAIKPRSGPRPGF